MRGLTLNGVVLRGWAGVALIIRLPPAKTLTTHVRATRGIPTRAILT